MPVCQLDGSGNVVAVQTFGPGGLLSQRTGGVSYFYAWDPTGHAALRRGGAGTASYAFDAFGQRAFSATADPFTGFLGKWGGYTDAETGLTLLTHRFYDAGTGRFLTRDPLGYAGGLDLYAYCLNDPVGRADPSGLDSGGAGGGPPDSMKSGRPGMEPGTPQNTDVNNMIGGLKDTLIGAAAGPVLDGVGAIVDGAIDAGAAVAGGPGCTKIAEGLKDGGLPGDIYRLEPDPAAFPPGMNMEPITLGGPNPDWHYHDVLHNPGSNEVYDPMTYGHNGPVPFDVWKTNFPYWDSYKWGPLISKAAN